MADKIQTEDFNKPRKLGNTGLALTSLADFVIGAGIGSTVGPFMGFFAGQDVIRCELNANHAEYFPSDARTLDKAYVAGRTSGQAAIALGSAVYLLR